MSSSQCGIEADSCEFSTWDAHKRSLIEQYRKLHGSCCSIYEQLIHYAIWGDKYIKVKYDITRLFAGGHFIQNVLFCPLQLCK